MGDSYRIRTELGINKTITVQLDQEFEFLEILSLKLQQEDIYIRSCADYGVVVGRVTANNGYGIPNARVSIFIPIESVDESNPIISSIYPYKSPTDKNEDGYRYNLLTYEKSYSTHAATGTLPSRTDVLTGSTAVEIFDKYYKYTSKTNESGDYMIMGVPLGFQTMVMDVDLSDIGEFSLTPQDLVRVGRATPEQVAGNKFRTSTDLDSLPQILTLQKSVEIAPLWGDPAICDIRINRVDFDLRDDASIDIQPTSVFMGSMFSTPDSFRLRGSSYFGGVQISRGCKPRDNMGNLCELQAGPGQILSIRQTIQQDSDGNPILEQYDLEQAGNIIDGDGTWLTEIPMNLDYVVTNEFGEKTISNDPTIGIPTKGKYRFKIKWQQPNTITQQVRRPYYLVPNIREYGWTNSSNLAANDPNQNPNITATNKKNLKGSYYFGLAWSGYTNVQAAIDCEDTFYQFDFNKVYTVSSLIDEYKNGRDRGRFIGIKEIDSQDCSSTVNKFPTNDGVRNFDLLYFIFSIIFQIIQLIGIPILIIFHFIAYLWNNFAAPFLVLIIAFFLRESIQNFFAAAVSFPALGLIGPFIVKGIINLIIAIVLGIFFRKITKYKFGRIKLAMITYPDCQACDCTPESTREGDGDTPTSLLTQYSNSGLYVEKLAANATPIKGWDDEDPQVGAAAFSQAMGGNLTYKNNNTIYKTMESTELRLPSNNRKFFAATAELPMGERINIFNLRKKYFDNLNRISVSFDTNSNNGIRHFDNTLTVTMQEKLESGTLLTFVSPTSTRDLNYLWSAATVDFGVVTGISGSTLLSTQGTVTVQYANPANQLQNLSQTYFLTTGSTEINYKFPSDLEYYQVVTAITMSQAAKMWNISNDSLFPGILQSPTSLGYNDRNGIGHWGGRSFAGPYKTADYLDGFENQYITIIQRGVDPYSPKYTNKYGIGRILGLSDTESLTITAQTRLNIPIQKLTSSSLSVQPFSSQPEIFYPSYFFRASDQFSGFTTSGVGYYSAFDANYVASRRLPATITTINNARGTITNGGNDSYNPRVTAAFYDFSEDLSGGAYYYSDVAKRPNLTTITYTSPSLLPTFTANPMSISSKTLNILRTDRLPSSDYLDGSGFNSNAALLQQNLGFSMYVINTDTEDFTSERFGNGATTYTPDIEGQVAATNVITTVGDCTKMVGLTCYSGNGVNFGVKEGCQGTDTIESGCYILMEKPLVTLSKDLKSFGEWGYRFRFFYGLCRGVLSQIFVNNWINGALYAFPIQVDRYFDKQNKPLPPEFCKDLIYFDSDTNNFYFRSSPYLSGSTQPFIGYPTQGLLQPVNSRNLLFPTTIVNLGIKDAFYQEIIFDPSAKGYILNKLSDTSYSDPSDLINLFVISRITDESFLQQLFAGFNKNNSLDQLFSRYERRIDGDLAQLLSINSEEGVIPFSPEFYASTGGTTDPVVIIAPGGDLRYPTMGVFFSSTTEDLQFKDFMTPGRIDFRPTNNANAITYPYGIKSQQVPFYQWGLAKNNTIFGTEMNNWRTNYSTDENAAGIFSRYIQSLDRTSIPRPSYFIPSNTSVSDTFARGYIFNVTDGGLYSIDGGTYPNQFLVGAPYHFYFGLIKGATALDKFKTKYSFSE